MGVETFDVKSELVTVTPAAAQHFRARLAAKALGAVRIGVRESGCTGFKYELDEVDAGQKDDLHIALDNGVDLYIDPQAVGFLRGTRIDYVREGINRTLQFDNPNVTAQCGCGESFTVE